MRQAMALYYRELIKSLGLQIVSTDFRHYGYSVYNMVVAHYPSFEWMPWNFRQVPTGYWLEAQNQYDYLALHASKRLGVKCLEDWYRVTTNDFTSHVRGFSMVAQYYKFSVIDMLNHLFPAFDCQPWKFSNVNRNYWQVTWNVINYILYAERELNIRHVTDWYSIGPKKLHSLHGGGLLNTQFGGSLVRLLEFVYPTKQWIPWRFGKFAIMRLNGLLTARYPCFLD